MGVNMSPEWVSTSGRNGVNFSSEYALSFVAQVAALVLLLLDVEMQPVFLLGVSFTALPMLIFWLRRKNTISKGIDFKSKPESIFKDNYK
jgi:hypothetical protein